MLYPREKLEKYGVEGLKMYELVAILLGTGSRSMPVLGLAKKVVTILSKKTPDWKGELERLPGIGPVKYKMLLAVIELGRRLLAPEANDLSVIRSREDVLRETRDLILLKKEHVVCLYLNGSNTLLEKLTISIGTVGESLVHPREVFAEAIALRATSIILVHNHPSGNPTPSEADIRVTERLCRAGEMLGIEVLDHIVIAKNGWGAVPMPVQHDNTLYHSVGMG